MPCVNQLIMTIAHEVPLLLYQLELELKAAGADLQTSFKISNGARRRKRIGEGNLYITVYMITTRSSSTKPSTRINTEKKNFMNLLVWLLETSMETSI